MGNNATHLHAQANFTVGGLGGRCFAAGGIDRTLTDLLFSLSYAFSPREVAAMSAFLRAAAADGRTAGDLARALEGGQGAFLAGQSLFRLRLALAGTVADLASYGPAFRRTDAPCPATLAAMFDAMALVPSTGGEAEVEACAMALQVTAAASGSLH